MTQTYKIHRLLTGRQISLHTVPWTKEERAEGFTCCRGLTVTLTCDPAVEKNVTVQVTGSPVAVSLRQ